eukprot:gene10927-12749_t
MFPYPSGSGLHVSGTCHNRRGIREVDPMDLIATVQESISQSEIRVNLCLKLSTVLANEEIIDRLSECGSHVVRQPLRQWVLKITQNADQLEEHLDASTSGELALQWPEGTLSAQKQWIGKFQFLR